MKHLVYEYAEKMAAKELFAAQLVEGLNSVLTKFRDRHNHFGQPIDEAFAWQLVADPVGTFDELLRLNAPFKAIAGKPLDIESLAKLVGIDRPAWLEACKILVPGSMNAYARLGTTAVFRLSDVHRPLVSWKDGRFVLNERVLADQLEAFKVYASTPEQLQEVKFWDDLATSLNKLVHHRILDNWNANTVAGLIPMLKVQTTTTGPNGQDKTPSFVVDAAKLAVQIFRE